MNAVPTIPPDRRTEMVQDCLSTLHAIVKDAKQPATARQQATRTLLEVLGVVGGRGGDSGAGQPLGASAAQPERPGEGLAALGDQELRKRLDRIRELQKEVTGLLPGGEPRDTQNSGSPGAVVSPLD